MFQLLGFFVVCVCWFRLFCSSSVLSFEVVLPGVTMVIVRLNTVVHDFIYVHVGTSSPQVVSIKTRPPQGEPPSKRSKQGHHLEHPRC